MERQPCVYMLASGRHGTLYVGVTSNLIARVHQHRTGSMPGFAARYEVKRLVWFEMHKSMDAAISREKQPKTWRCNWKIARIEAENPFWEDRALSFRLPAPPVTGHIVTPTEVGVHRRFTRWGARMDADLRQHDGANHPALTPWWG